METHNEQLLQELKRMETRYPALEKSIVDLKLELEKSPRSHNIKQKLAHQKALRREWKTKAEEIRQQLDLPIQEEDK